MKKIRLLALLILGSLIGTAYAQSIRVSGVVKSSEDGQPLPGVTVLVKGTNNGFSTGADGSYILNNVPSNGTLEFRYVGMKTQNVSVAGKTTINVTMQPDAIQIESVVVTAMGVKKQDRKIGYAVTTVKGDDIAKTNTINPIAALQGKVAGVQISSIGSSGVTASPMIVIRGAKSLTKSNQPIFVIDGVIMSGQEAGRGSSNSGVDGYGSQLKNLNPDDYESITVLKGAAATSLYGSQGANGAVVITTKSGKSRKGIGVEASYTHGFNQVYRAPFDMNNEFGSGDYASGYEGDIFPTAPYTYKGYAGGNWGPKAEGQMLQQFYKMPENPEEPYVVYKDNWKQLFEAGSYDRANFAITGGSEKATFRLSYGYTNMKGNIPNNKFSSHNVQFSANGQINDILSTDFNFMYTNSVSTNRQQQGAWWYGDNYTMLTGYYMNRNTDLGWFKDNYLNEGPNEQFSRREILGGMSTVADYLDKKRFNNEVQNEQTIIAQLGVTAKLTSWLDLNGMVSFNNWQRFREEKNWGAVGKYRGGYFGIWGDNSTSYRTTAALHSNNRFVDDNLELDIRVGAEAYGNGRSNNFSRGTNGGLMVPGLYSFANSAKPVTTDNIGVGYSPRNSMTLGVYGIVNLSWKDQINLELTARNDWLSSLTYPTWIVDGANNYSVFYPSANLSWVFSDTFSIDPSIVSFGKLRASFAQVGMGTGAYSTADGAGGFSLKSVKNPMGTDIYSASPNNTTLPNYDLKPEIQQSIEFGADVRFLNDRIGVDVTYYKSNTFNQIMNIGMVGESGVNNRWINAGNIQNQGWEILLNFTPIRTRDVTWDISVNWTRNRSLIKELHEQSKQIQLSSHGFENSATIYAIEGMAYGVVVGGSGSYGGAPRATVSNPNDPNFGKHLLRVGASTDGLGGSIPYVSWVTGNQISGYYGGKTDYDGTNRPSYDIIGNVEPDFYAGFNTSLQYKDFMLTVQIDGRVGGKLINTSAGYIQGRGATKTSLYGRSAEHGGEARTNWKGETVYNGVVVDGVFWDNNGSGTFITSIKTGEKMKVDGMSMREVVDAGHMQPMLAAIFYAQNMGNNGGTDLRTKDATYFSLRDITLSYNFPEKWVKHIGMQSARLSFSAQNLCYLYNGLISGSNPESIISNNPLTPIDFGGVPYSRTFALSLNVRF